jgi:hypothetical protein
MKRDRFWETFWLSFFGLTLLSILGSGALFFSHIHGINAAAVGIVFDPNRNPFETTLHRTNTALVDGYIYRNSLPLGVSHWSWDSSVDWISTAKVYEGSAALRATFLKPWAGVGLNGFSIKRSDYRSVSLAVYPDNSVEDLYLELYDAEGNSMGRQSLAWYAPGGKFKTNTWQYLSVPLENLVGSSRTSAITGLSVSAQNAGQAYLDSIQFTTTSVVHPLWTLPQYVEQPPYNPFATSTPTPLPYIASFNETDFSRWHSYYGRFERSEGSFKIGPKLPDMNDSVSAYRSGFAWSDYRVDVRLDWGLTSAFSILLRLTDASNFVSCAFSYYGQTATIYHVKNGVSTALIQSPALAIPFYEPWKDVKVGAAVQGNRVSCFVNGERIIWIDVPDLTRFGTLGLEAWDANVNSSPHTIHKLEVRQLIGE